MKFQITSRNAVFLLFSIIFLVTTFAGCKNTLPEKATAVKDFSADKYLGKWYELARIDFKFEKHLTHTTAEYTALPNEKINVVNRGFDTVAQKWKAANGKAKFVGEKNIAQLQVSFFGPFYSGYNVLAVDDEYQYALVGGENYDNLWVLSRTTTIPPEIKKNYVKIAEENGYETQSLIWVDQSLPIPNPVN